MRLFRILLCAALFTVPACAQILSNAFGFQCGLAAGNCPNEVWPATTAQPKQFRMWDVSITPGEVMLSYDAVHDSGTYDWSKVDAWLADLAAHPGVTGWYTFGDIPCWATTGTCGTRGSASPPTDLTAAGSPTFTRYVTDFVNHCDASGDCVKDLIKYYGWWNEANISQFWAGSQIQLYQMGAAAWPVLFATVTGAHLSTPEFSGSSGFQAAIISWINLEITNGIKSTEFAFHLYLNDLLPETRITTAAQQTCPNTGLSPCSGPIAGWTTLPQWMEETSWNTTTYVCNTVTYTASECAGQMLRWQLLLMSGGVKGVNWYKWKQVIGNIGTNQTGYYNMMSYLIGGTLANGACTSSGSPTVYVCPFTQGNGTISQFVWAPAGATSYTVPALYMRYRDLNGSVFSVTPGQSITIDGSPLMLEQTAIVVAPARGLFAKLFR